MSPLRSIGLILVGVGIVVSVINTGAFTSADVNRNTPVSVSDDSSALLSLDTANPVEASKSEDNRLVTVTNNLDKTQNTSLDLESKTDDGVQLKNNQEIIPPGGSATFQVDITREEQPEVIEFQLTSTGSTDIDLTRQTIIEDIELNVCRGDTFRIEDERERDIENRGTNIEVKSE